jgi:NAD(P)-dependent dehydrogenase (short-subunit alcohol dehydrogenase family)
MNWPASGSDISGRLALVTGAARGIGLGIAQQLVAAGAVVIATDRDAAALKRAFPAGDAALLELDVAGDSEALAPAVLDRFGTPQLIVNNVGVTTGHGFLELSEGDFDAVLRTNLRGPWFLTRGLIDSLVRSGTRGNVVFVSSLHDHRIRGNPHYSASKAAIAMLVRELAYELAPRGIRVNAVSPGWVAREGEKLDKRSSRRIPLGRAGTPADVANIALVLLSDELSGYVTGVNIPVDGGLALHSWLSK